ncbi:MAG: hypothetical protein ACI33M_10085, partial [Lysinibacillus sp.]
NEIMFKITFIRCFFEHFFKNAFLIDNILEQFYIIFSFILQNKVSEYETNRCLIEGFFLVIMKAVTFGG